MWFVIWYLTFPRLIAITFKNGIFPALAIALMILLFDLFLGNIGSRELKHSWELKVAKGLRYALSFAFSILGGFGLTVAFFLTQINRYLKGVRANYIQKFVEGISTSYMILGVFMLIVLSLFAFDAIPRLVSILKAKNSQAEEARLRAENERLRAEQLNKEVSEQQQIIKYKNEELKESYQQQLLLMQSVSHELGGRLFTLKTQFSYVYKFFASLAKKDVAYSPDLLLRKPLVGEPKEQVDSIGQSLERITKGLGESTQIITSIKAIVQADAQNFKPESVQLGSWLKMQMPGEVKLCEGLAYEITGVNPRILAVVDQLNILLHNVIKNAWHHALSDYSDGEKFIKCELFEDMNSAILQISNTGHTLPQGFTDVDFLAKGITGGRNPGTGLGGYLISIVAANHDAAVQLKPAEDLPFTTCFQIRFTKKQQS